jgi:beta-glucosidase
LQGLKNRLGDSVQILYSTGDSILQPKLLPVESEFLFTPDKKENGLKGEYFSNKELEGEPTIIRIDKKLDFDFGTKSPGEKIKHNFFSIRWSGFIKVKESGKYTFGTLSDDGIRLFIDDKKVIENWNEHGIMIDEYVAKLEAGKEYKVKLEYYEEAGDAVIKLGLRKDTKTDANPIADAAKVAQKADIAIIFAGANSALESEGRDRDKLELPGKQEELINAVAKANPNTIVVINGGTPTKTKSWLNKVKALVHMYYIGQETGNAIAAVLMGDVNPSGKLPFSFIADYDQSPAFKGYKDKGLKVKYDEGIFVGYKYLDKNKLEPTFPFGFGLSYTTFKYESIKVTPQANNIYEVTVEITNTGKVIGDEVVQLYLSDIECSVPRPVKELKGFSRVSLNTGETKTVKMQLKERDFAFWDIKSNNWKIEPGDYEIQIGSSARDIILKEKITLK